MFTDQRAIGQQLIALRMIHAAESQQFFVGKVEIEAGAAHAFGAVAREDGGNVRLVRRLVVGKARIAINAEDRSLRIRNVTWGKARKSRIQLLYQLQHGDLDQRFISLLPRLKPLAPIVALQIAEEGESVG